MQRRFEEQLRRLGLDGPGVSLLVAVSGGLDSVVLLHLLRFRSGSRIALAVAHFDHCMRADSDADRAWVAGLCRAWDIPLLTERASAPLGNEGDARRARYRMLRAAAARVGATYLATAHHADDQAETVLFRLLRGTGIGGLGGIPPAGPAGLVRPLLPFWRREIREYARTIGLRWRDDPTNQTLDPVRNRIRHELLPWIEREVAPGARPSLVRLGEAAAETERALDALIEPLAAATIRADGDALVLARAPLRGYDLAVASRILRDALRQLGTVLDRAGTRAALQFITNAASGRELHLAGGVRVRIEFDEARLEAVRTALPDQALHLPLPGEGAAAGGQGIVRLGGRVYGARWSVAEFGRAPGNPDAAATEQAFRLGALRFPLHLRARQPGDRIRTTGGTRTLKQLLIERRVPVSRRAQLPLLVDATGDVLWVVGVARAPAPAAQPGSDALFLAITEA